MSRGLADLVRFHQTGRFALVEQILQILQENGLLLIEFVAGFGHGQGFGQAPFDGIEVGKDQLGIDHLDVAQGIDVARHMDNVVVLEAAHHMGDGVDLADVAEKLVAESLALAGPGHQAGDIDEFHLGIDLVFGLDQGGQGIEPPVGHRHHADIGFDGAERVVGRLDAGGGKGVEYGRFADIGQADNAAAESHGASGES